MYIRWESKETIHATYLKLIHGAVSGSNDDSAAHGSTLARDSLLRCAHMFARVISCMYTMHAFTTPRYLYLVQATDTLD
ncbi:unnamed protein product [Urochloa humidicola]